MKNTKKGFTIIELVIVIAVIGILAGVLIPTFSTVIANANKSAAVQAVSAGKSILANDSNLLVVPEGTVFLYDVTVSTKADELYSDGFAFIETNGKEQSIELKDARAATGKTYQILVNQNWFRTKKDVEETNADTAFKNCHIENLVKILDKFFGTTSTITTVDTTKDADGAYTVSLGATGSSINVQLYTNSIAKEIITLAVKAD